MIYSEPTSFLSILPLLPKIFWRKFGIISRRERKEGTKEENSFVSTATEHPEKDILNLFRSLWA